MSKFQANVRGRWGRTIALSWSVEGGPRIFVRRIHESRSLAWNGGKNRRSFACNRPKRVFKNKRAITVEEPAGAKREKARFYKLFANAPLHIYTNNLYI
jgi:hypothetical protein